MIVILSGPVGAGKTTVARELLATAPAPAAYVEGDVFWSFIAKPKAADDRGEGFRMIVRAMLATARHMDRDGYGVLVDFSIPPWLLDGVRALLVDKPFEYVVLRPSEAVCAARAAARTAGRIEDYARYRELYDAFDALPAAIVSDDESPAAAVAAQIRAGLAAGRFRIG